MDDEYRSTKAAENSVDVGVAYWRYLCIDSGLASVSMCTCTRRSMLVFKPNGDAEVALKGSVKAEKKKSQSKFLFPLGPAAVSSQTAAGGFTVKRRPQPENTAGDVMEEGLFTFRW